MISEIDETIISENYDALTAEEREVLITKIDTLGASSMEELFLFLKDSGYRISFSAKYQHYLVAIPVLNRGGAIVDVGSDYLSFQMPNQSRVMMSFGYIQLKLQ